ncbi:MAG TPA: FxSxx-COOH system tetratricopeptide repeat protein [Micromonosporaceae bacterium]|nr:FxSxx-COOH system tetratricopeptide repeat protein [Micromonosporaceae bacterium]
MISRLVRSLGRAASDVTATELADAVWLAMCQAQARGLAGTGGVESRHGSHDEMDAPEPASKASPQGSRLPSTPSRWGGPGPSSIGGQGLYTPAGRRAGSVAGAVVRAPSVGAVFRKLALIRSLRPLRRTVRSATRLELDEAGTVAATAEARLYSSTPVVLPVCRPRRERWLDLVLLVDESASMVLWHHAAGELCELMHRLGAFRDIRVLRFDADPHPGEPLVLYGAVARSPHRAEEFVHPAANRAFLVLSDCVGRRWINGEIAPLLETWGRTGPLAVVQPLPQELWGQCAVPIDPRAVLWFTRPGQPNVRLRPHPTGPSALSGRVPGLSPEGMAVPVVHLDPAWLASWARAVGGTMPGRRTAAAMFTGRMTESGPEQSLEATDSKELVRRFLSCASDNARTLAAHLAAAPLNLNTMRLVHRATVAQPRIGDLAEVFLGGLLCQTGAPARDDQPPDEIEYDFRPGVRDELLKLLPRPNALRVLDQVSSFITSRAGARRDFAAVVAAPRQAGLASGPMRPFAVVAHDVLAMLGGGYATMAERLQEGMHPLDVIPRRQALRTRFRAASQPAPPPDTDARAAGGAAHTKVPSTAGHQGAPVTASTAAGAASSMDPSALPGAQLGAQPEVWGGVPSRLSTFTGRRKVLAQIRRWLHEPGSTSLEEHEHSRTLVLQGIGGVGKTQVAIEYANRFRGSYDVVWWVYAQDETVIRRSLVSLASRLELPGGDSQNAIDTVLEALRLGRPYPRWLLIYDGADDPQALTSYLPVPTGHILVTTRSTAWSGLGRVLPLREFDPEESVHFVRNRGRDIDEDQALRLAERLGHFPLALEQAAAWQAETGTPVEEFLETLDENLDAVLSSGRPLGYPVPLAIAWRTIFDSLRSAAPTAAALLELSAFLSSQPVSVPMIRRARGAELPPELDAAVRDATRLRQAIGDLNRYALARVDHRRNTFTLHPLVRQVISDQLPAADRERLRRSAHQLLAFANPGDPDDPSTWLLHAEVAPHVVPSGVIGSPDPDARKAALDQIRYFFQIGDYQTSVALGREVVAQWRRQLGPDDEMTLIASRHLANSLRTLGRYDEARAMNEETLVRMKATLGEDNVHTLVTANIVGADLRVLGQFRVAHQHDEYYLGLHERVFGWHDPNTLRSANNLAVDLRLLGRFQEALRLDERICDARVMLYGEEHPQTVYGFTNVARDLYGLGRYRQALQLLEEMLPRQEQALGRLHSEVMLAYRTVGVLYRKTGQYERAREVSGQIFDSYRQRFGVGHEYSLQAMNSYVNALRVTEEPGAAEELGRQALELHRQAFGEAHPSTLASAVNLAVVLSATGAAAEAMALAERTLAELSRPNALGEDHPYTLCCANNLANSYSRTGRHDTAIELLERTLARSQEMRGRDHPDSLTVAANLALALGEVGRGAESQERLAAVLVRMRDVLGERHPEVESLGTGVHGEADVEPPPS